MENENKVINNIDESAEETVTSELKRTFIKQEETDKPNWYVVYTYSGYENKVMDQLKLTMKNHKEIAELILDVKVPMEETIIENKNNKRKRVQRKLYAGYVMVKMLMTDQSWYIVRNTHGVTGFVGPGNKAIPLTDREVKEMGLENVSIELDVEVGNNIEITSGPLRGFVGKVTEVNNEREKVRVSISMFGRDTDVELDFVQVKRI